MITYRGQQTPRRSLAMPLTRLYYMEKSVYTMRCQL